MKRAPPFAVLWLVLVAHLLGCGGTTPCVPVDDEDPCTDDLCEGGVAVHLPASAGTSCATGGQCDGMGNCVVGCLLPTECPGIDDECQARTCQAGTCGLSFTASGTPVAAQTPNDCQQAVCDGQGKVTSVADDSDLPLDDGNVCTDEACAAGAPGHPAKVDGTGCHDGDACTQTDTCQAGFCAGGNPVVCAAADACHAAGVCDPTSGACSSPAVADGASCNDGDACTQTDTCQSGTCTGGNPVVCAASDQCHTVGVCDPTSGTCSNPTANNGSACNDGNACTQTDTCQSGVCTGSNAVVCSASDPCHVPGACNPASGTCSSPPAANGTSCDDGNACTKADQCTGGVCGGTAYACASTNCDVSSTCDGNGGCTIVDKANGTSCPDDGNPCTSDACDGSGNCAHPALASGTSCGAGLVCNGAVCSSGCFIGGSLHAPGTVNPTNACQVCTPGASTTAWSSQSNGTSCSDGNACTQTDTCQAGTCTGGTPVVCAALDACHAAGVCDPSSGACSNPPAANGTPCDDGNACSLIDTCQAGTCVGHQAVACAPLDACHIAGACNPATGTCSNPVVSDGHQCHNSNACIFNEICQAGTCTGGHPAVCVTPDVCHVAGVCNPATGTCSLPPAPDGTSCNDGDACTLGDGCKAGACVGGSPLACSTGASCVGGACTSLTSTWGDCTVGLDPTKNGGDLIWEQSLQLPWQNIGALERLGLGPTGDIGLGVGASSVPQGLGHHGTAAYQLLNGSGVPTVSGSYRALNGGVSTGIDWGGLTIAENNDLLIYVGGDVGCGAGGTGVPPTCPGPVVTYSGPSASASLDCNGSSSLGYCHDTIMERRTQAGQISNAPATPDGMGGSYVAGNLGITTDLGCGPMVPGSSSSGFVAHLGPASSCIFSRVLPSTPSGLLADANGVVLHASSTAGVDLGCGLLAAAPGGSSFITRLDPAGSCVSGVALAAPGLAVALDPGGSVVVSALVGATTVDLGGGPLAPIGSQDVVLGEIDALSNPLWSRRLGSPGLAMAGANVTVSQAGDVYLRTGWSGSVDLGGGAISATSSHTVVGSYAPSGAHRWSHDFPIAGSYLAGIDGCGGLVVASVDPSFDPGTGKILPPFLQPFITVAVLRYAP